MANIIELLQKLINHERSSRSIGNIAEAEAFAAKIQTMLMEHKLSMSEVEYEEQGKCDPIGTGMVEAHEIGMEEGRREVWLEHLAGAIASNFFCRTLHRRNSKSAIFVGRNSDRAAAVEMFCYLVGLARTICDKEFREHKKNGAVTQQPMSELDKVLAELATLSGKSAQGRIWKRSFLEGFAHAISSRLHATRKSLEASASAQAAGLMLRNQHEVQQYIEERFHPRNGRPSSTGSYNPYAAKRGAHHGSQVSLKARTALPAGHRSER